MKTVQNLTLIFSLIVSHAILKFHHPQVACSARSNTKKIATPANNKGEQSLLAFSPLAIRFLVCAPVFDRLSHNRNAKSAGRNIMIFLVSLHDLRRKSKWRRFIHHTAFSCASSGEENIAAKEMRPILKL